MVMFRKWATQFTPESKPISRARTALSCAVLAALGLSWVAEAAGPEPTFTAATGSPFMLASDSPSAVAVGDFNGDGNPDVVTPHAFSSYASVLLGDGAGGFTPAPSSPVEIGGFFPISAQVTDVNGDGKPDFVTANYYSDDVSVMLGDGSGGFTPATGSPFAVAGVLPCDVAVADFNGDGHPDLATADFLSYNASVLLGDGTGSFTLVDDAPFIIGYYPSAVATADVNGDGKPDVVTSNFSPDFTPYVSILLGDGTGGFAAPLYSGLDGTVPGSLNIADVNGDGKPDLITANSMTDDVSVILGDGTGYFTPAPASPFAVDGSRPLGADVLDVNGDGKLDIVIASDGDDDISVLLGNGAGGFVQAAAGPWPAGDRRPFSVVGADVNHDGKPDLLTPNSFGDTLTVLLNATVSADTTPPTGVPLAVGTTGASNGQAYVPVRVQDAGSGVKRIELTANCTNVHLEYPLGTPVTSPLILPTPLADVMVYGVKNTNAKSRVELKVTDAAGNFAVTDPIIANLELKKAGQLTRTFKQIPQAERYVRLTNGTPGFKNARMWINGKVVTRGSLTDGQIVDLDVAEWLKPGNRNTAKITAAGPKGATAILTIGDVATSDGAAVLRASSRFNLEFSR